MKSVDSYGHKKNMIGRKEAKMKRSVLSIRNKTYWPTGGFWLYNRQFFNVGPTVAFHQWANGVFLFKMAMSNNRGFLET